MITIRETKTDRVNDISIDDMPCDSFGILTTGFYKGKLVYNSGSGSGTNDFPYRFIGDNNGYCKGSQQRVRLVDVTIEYSYPK